MVADERQRTGTAAGLAPRQLALRRLRRNRAALAFGALFVVLVVLALAAPLWAQIAGTGGPSRNHLTDTIVLDGKTRDIVSDDRIPIGPTWRPKYLLGADGNGRDVAVRLLYGARNSLFIGVAATVGSVLLAVTLGLLAGYFRCWVDALISRGLDVVWAFPALLLGIALGVSLSVDGLQLGPLSIDGDSKWIPTLIIAVVSAVYLARPSAARSCRCASRSSSTPPAPRARGRCGSWSASCCPTSRRRSSSSFPLLVANAILLEAALSFLGAGVKAPDP